MKKILQNIKQNIALVAIVLVVGMILGWLFFIPKGESPKNENLTESHEGHDHESEDPAVWTCSMHPQIKQNKPGLCPICAMDLIPLAAMGSGGDNADPNEISMTESAAKLADIQTLVVGKGTPQKSIRLQGKIQEDERNISELTARFGGRIEELFVNYTGQNVKKGERLATIYSPELVTAQRELIISTGFTEIRPELYIAAKEKLKQWNLTDEQIEAIEEKGKPELNFNILSPISGTVSMRHVAKGDYVKKGMPLFKLVDLTKLWALFDAYESDLPWINIGDEVEFTIQSLPGKTFTGKVSFIDPFIDKKTRIAKVRVEVDNSELNIKPEMFISGIVKSKIANSEDKIIIPKSALLWTGKRSIVYVKVKDRENPTFLYREIVLGPEAGDSYVVAEGLREREEIAINGVFKIDAAAQLQGLTSMMNPAEAQGEITSFKVGGLCEMCKDRIEEAALSVDGVISADWDSESQILLLNYNKGIDVDKVHNEIARVGHDTEKMKASDDVYENLPECCWYERIDVSKTVNTNFKHEMVKVGGLCGMCKDRIESAAMTVEGVRNAEWDADTQILHLDYNTAKTNSDKIQIAIAATGHDTEKYKAPDDVYNDLAECCWYDRFKY